jgi:hypothetical protein
MAVTATLPELVDQALDNERWRLRRAALAAIEGVTTSKPYDSYSNPSYNKERCASDVKAEIKLAVERALA